MNEITLKDIVEVFNAPINEEQAWAVLHEAAVFLNEKSSSNTLQFAKFSGLQSLCFDSSGIISISSDFILYKDQEQESLNFVEKTNVCNKAVEKELVKCLGIVIFQALDYSLNPNEEHELSEAMESVLDRMVCEEEESYDQHDNEQDEGIVQDSGHNVDCSSRNCHMFTDVIEWSQNHLSEPLSAAEHYHAVCQAMVTEARELKTFLVKISQQKEKMKSVDTVNETNVLELKKAEWARLWMLVIRQLREGVTLRKFTRLNLPPIEYELTPYEMLMDDIRSCRYTLKNITIEEPVLAKSPANAHDLILDFIKSRPTLQPMQHRKLRDISPPEPGVRERLLEAIKKEPRLRSAPNLVNLAESARMSLDESTLNQPRKVIKPDLSLIQSYSFDTENDLSDEDNTDEKNKVLPPPITPFTPLSPTKTSPTHWHSTVEKEMESSSRKFFPFLERRHSIPTCETPSDPKKSVTFDPNNSAPVWDAILTGTNSIRNRPVSLQSADCLSLTIEEVIHIRRVLAKAELESLIVHPELYQLVAKGKVCFTCLKTKFSILGPWGSKCHICGRIVCSRCINKMRVPAEHFERIPVYTLSPGALSPASQEETTSSSSGLTPTSPSMQATSPKNENTHNSRMISGELERARTALYETSQKLFEGPMMHICRDCKAMLLEIIRASRLSVDPLLNNAEQQSAMPNNVCISTSPRKLVPRNFMLELHD